MFDQQQQSLVRARHAANRLYVLQLDLAAPACLVSKLGDPSWLWHARLGHLHFNAINAMSKRGMVCGMPRVDHVDKVYDSCTVGKEHRLAFLRASPHRSKHALSLVHTNLRNSIK